MNKLLFFLIFIIFDFTTAQSIRSTINKGNSFFKEEKFSDSEAEYKKALEKDSNSNVGKYNLGDALYKQKRYSDAIKEFTSSMENENDKKEISDIYYNIGNSQLEEKKYQEAIESYKKSLRNNSNDEDSRYNLAYAQRMLIQEQKQKEENKKDKNKDKKENQKEKQKNDEQQKEEKKQEEKSQSKPKPQISKEESERILSALENKDKETQKKLKARAGVKVGVEKDW